MLITLPATAGTPGTMGMQKLVSAIAGRPAMLLCRDASKSRDDCKSKEANNSRHADNKRDASNSRGTSNSRDARNIRDFNYS
jgi:hypothetical protein